ncbi:MAG: coproporphyrinogen III oxidase, partial [Lysobacterales bacterium]
VSMAAVEDRFGINFSDYFQPDLERLQALVADDLVQIGPDLIRATARGRLLLRVLCACFDRYLHQAPPAAPARFSSVV